MDAYTEPPAPTSQPQPDRRKHRRRGTAWRAQLATVTGSFECRIRNLSLRGAMVQLEQSVAVAERITLILEPSIQFAGVVAWQRNGFVGIRIKEQLTPWSEAALPSGTA